MKKAFAAICASFIVLALVYIRIGGSFGRQFWLGFLPGVVENLIILAVAVLVIDRIFKKERVEKLEQTNARQAWSVLFLTNRLAFLLLKHLGLATMEEAHKDPLLDFEFAQERLGGIDLAAVFYEELMKAEDRETFAGGFEEVLHRETGLISKALEKIYPQPDPGIVGIVDQMNVSIGSLGALKMFFGAFKAANGQVRPDQRLRPEHLEVLTKVTYGQIGLELQKIRRTIGKLAESAKANKLFVCFD